MKNLIHLFAVLLFVTTLSMATTARADDKSASAISTSDAKSAVSASDDANTVSSASDDKSASDDNTASIDNTTSDSKDYSDSKNDGGKSTPLPINNGLVFLLVAGLFIGITFITKNKSVKLVPVNA